MGFLKDVGGLPMWWVVVYASGVRGASAVMVDEGDISGTLLRPRNRSSTLETVNNCA